MACTFSREGVSTVTVQVSVGNTILQDRKTIAVHGEQTHDLDKLQRVFTQIRESLQPHITSTSQRSSDQDCSSLKGTFKIVSPNFWNSFLEPFGPEIFGSS